LLELQVEVVVPAVLGTLDEAVDLSRQLVDAADVHRVALKVLDDRPEVREQTACPLTLRRADVQGKILKEMITIEPPGLLDERHVLRSPRD